MYNQIFPIFDPVTKACVGMKPRNQVHHSGDWHMGVQAFIFRKTVNNEIEVLVQKRSAHVDISAHMFDQSLAVHVIEEDALDLKQSLRRGLKNELDLDFDCMRSKQSQPNVTIQIVKTYSQDNSILNREYVHLYLFEYDESCGKITPNVKKVDQLLWISWEKYTSWLLATPTAFAKTARCYSADPFLRKAIDDDVKEFLFGEKQKTKIRKPKRICYYSTTNSLYDIAMHQFEANQKEGSSIVYFLDRANHLNITHSVTDKSEVKKLLPEKLYPYA